MTSEKGGKKDKNQNIQVFVRLRPLNQREHDIRSLGVVEVVNNREVVVRQSQSTSHTKKFTFDRAFGPYAKQLEVYQDVVSPLIEEVLAGYNCTVFAYGQTGTGKTHTMVGQHTGETTTWQNDPLAGIIPRALSQLFDELRLSNTEYTVRVSYLELYNEELFDLLSSSEDNSKLRIYEDITRKGSNIVNGLEEITVYNKTEVYKIMAQGQDRKRVASTLMNAQSSRSHTVFTIVVHMKENSPEGEELVKIGKLNLVDLAGSENISKAGSDNPAKRERARECVNINQSLLTLGRVITALVERHPHIPYRESKLTRILQESLGGRTKTSIIATISPGHKDLEETMSTLEYANRAKNIQNKPEVNQKMTKKAILKEYAEEIDRLKRDLTAARDKSGVYLANETFAEMQDKQEQQKKEIQELLLHKRAVEEERDKIEGVFSELKCKLQARESELENTRRQLDSTVDKLETTSDVLQKTKLQLSEQAHLLTKTQATEQQLNSQAKELLTVADTASDHVAKLHQAVETRKMLESQNLQVTQAYRAESELRRRNIAREVDSLVDQLTATCADLNTLTEKHINDNLETYGHNKQTLDQIAEQLAGALSEIKHLTATTGAELATETQQHRAALQQSLAARSDSVRQLLRRFVEATAECAERARQAGEKGNADVNSFVTQWYTGSNQRVTSLRSSHSAAMRSWRQSEARRLESARRHAGTRQAQCERRAELVSAGLTVLAAESSKLDERLTQRLSKVEEKRKQNEDRLQQWVQEEREIFERRISRHVEQQRKFTEESLDMELKEIEVGRSSLGKLMAEEQKLRELQSQLSGEEIEYEAEAVKEYETGQQECEKHLTGFEKVFDHGTSAISAEMEALSQSVLRVVEHVQQLGLCELLAARDYVERGVTEVESTDEQNAQQFSEEMDGLFSNAVCSSLKTMQTVVECVENATSTSRSHVSALAASTAALDASGRELLLSSRGAVQRGAAAAACAGEGVRHALAGWADVEGNYLGSEYSLYRSSGSTPARQEYRYPRELAATSPHERILARFRAMRQNSDNDDCIIVESAASSLRNSSSSSLSEVSAPSPPAAAPVLKSTSETDIYRMMKHQEKENPQSASTQRSKLRVPKTFKKPLVERNTPS